jgi:hypothetical protein
VTFPGIGDANSHLGLQAHGGPTGRCIATCDSLSSSAQFHTCTTEHFVDIDLTEISCISRNSSGSQKACVSDDPGIIAAANALNVDSYLEWSMDSFFNCSFIQVENGSSLSPKAP